MNVPLKNNLIVDTPVSPAAGAQRRVHRRGFLQESGAAVGAASLDFSKVANVVTALSSPSSVITSVASAASFVHKITEAKSDAISDAGFKNPMWCLYFQYDGVGGELAAIAPKSLLRFFSQYQEYYTSRKKRLPAALFVSRFKRQLEAFAKAKGDAARGAHGARQIIGREANTQIEGSQALTDKLQAVYRDFLKAQNPKEAVKSIVSALLPDQNFSSDDFGVHLENLGTFSFKDEAKNEMWKAFDQYHESGFSNIYSMFLDLKRRGIQELSAEIISDAMRREVLRLWPETPQYSESLDKLKQCFTKCQIYLEEIGVSDEQLSKLKELDQLRNRLHAIAFRTANAVYKYIPKEKRLDTYSMQRFKLPAFTKHYSAAKARIEALRREIEALPKRSDDYNESVAYIDSKIRKITDAIDPALELTLKQKSYADNLREFQWRRSQAGLGRTHIPPKLRSL